MKLSYKRRGLENSKDYIIKLFFLTMIGTRVDAHIHVLLGSLIIKIWKVLLPLYSVWSIHLKTICIVLWFLWIKGYNHGILNKNIQILVYRVLQIWIIGLNQIYFLRLHVHVHVYVGLTSQDRLNKRVWWCHSPVKGWEMQQVSVLYWPWLLLLYFFLFGFACSGYVVSK